MGYSELLLDNIRSVVESVFQYFFRIIDIEDDCFVSCVNVKVL